MLFKVTKYKVLNLITKAIKKYKSPLKKRDKARTIER